MSFDIDDEVESSRLSSLTSLSSHAPWGLQVVFNEIKIEFYITFGCGKDVVLRHGSFLIAQSLQFIKEGISIFVILICS